MTYIIGSLFVAIPSLYIFSGLLRISIFKKYESPKRQIYSAICFYPVIAYIYGTGDNGNYLDAMIVYGIATFLLVLIHIALDHLSF